MKVCVVASGARIEPFACGVNDVPIGAGTLASARLLALRAAGLVEPNTVPTLVGDDELIEGPALVVKDDVWLTRRALRGFVRAAAAASAPVRLCLPRSRLLELTLPLQDLAVDGEGRAAFDVAYLPAGSRARAQELFALEPDRWCAAPYRERLLQVPVPRHILGVGDSTLAWPLTSTVAMRVRHWLHVLRAGHVAPQVALLDRAAAHPLATALRLLPALRPSGAATLRALPGRLVFTGRRTHIHPSAVVESCVLGDDVTVGAHCYLRNSVIGDGCVIEQRAHVNGCALGPRTFVSLNSTLSACVTFGDTDACANGIQACVVGPRCALTSFARPFDLAPGAAVKVDDGGALRAVGELPCGVAFGPDVFVGAGVAIAAGRAIPRGVRLVGDPAATLTRVRADTAPGWYAVVGGAMAPLGAQGEHEGR
ncbi:MAG: hypothetical protein IT383_09845 [Deltaproteobacteria bacterium]|nr:hypothetical protein [Deltaproteobacteria bacterium]